MSVILLVIGIYNSSMNLSTCFGNSNGQKEEIDYAALEASRKKLGVPLYTAEPKDDTPVFTVDRKMSKNFGQIVAFAAVYPKRFQKILQDHAALLTSKAFCRYIEGVANAVQYGAARMPSGIEIGEPCNLSCYAL